MKKFSVYLVHLFIGLLILNLLVIGIKQAVKRPRPTSILKDYSFPSAHSANAFFIAHYLTAGYFCLNAKSRKTKGLPGFYLIVFLYLSAILVGVSRLYYNVHYLSDVVMGGIIGFVFAQLLLIYIKVRYALCGQTPKKTNKTKN